MNPKERSKGKVGLSIMAVMIVGFVALSVAVLVDCSHSDRTSSHAAVVRVGWATTWATQGQVIESLKSTDILRTNGLTADFSGFPSAVPEIEAALAGRLDVVSGASQPIIQLVADSSNWVIVSRNAYIRVALLVPIDSHASTLADLKGKTIGLPLGTTAQNFILLRAQAEGLPESDFKLLNLPVEEQGTVALAGPMTWGPIDAICTWEPTVSLILRGGTARVLEEDDDVTLTAMSRTFIASNRDTALAYLRSTLEAWFYYARHRQQMDAAYIKDTAIPLDVSTLESISQNEPNAHASSIKQVNISLTPAILAKLQSTADLLTKDGVLNSVVQIATKTDPGLLQAAASSLESP